MVLTGASVLPWNHAGARGAVNGTGRRSLRGHQQQHQQQLWPLEFSPEELASVPETCTGPGAPPLHPRSGPAHLQVFMDHIWKQQDCRQTGVMETSALVHPRPDVALLSPPDSTRGHGQEDAHLLWQQFAGNQVRSQNKNHHSSAKPARVLRGSTVSKRFYRF